MCNFMMTPWVANQNLLAPNGGVGVPVIVNQHCCLKAPASIIQK